MGAWDILAGRPLLRMIPAAAALALLVGCGGMRMDVAAPTSATTASLSPTPRLSAPPVDMSGRWTLSSTAASGGCAMTFTGGAGTAGEGAIRPEGGCPGNFFTSRKWTFEDGAIIMRDHKGERLGQLTLAGPGRFQGQSAAGQSITLTR